LKSLLSHLLTPSLAWAQKNFGFTLGQIEEQLRAVDAMPPNLICLPIRSGSQGMFDNAAMYGAFFGLTARHTTADMYYAMLEGMCSTARQSSTLWIPQAPNILP